jgi:hypothetical protein
MDGDGAAMVELGWKACKALAYAFRHPETKLFEIKQVMVKILKKGLYSSFCYFYYVTFQ